MSNETKSVAQHFWLTKELLDEVVIIQHEYMDERPAHTVRRLIREALAARAREAEGP